MRRRGVRGGCRQVQAGAGSKGIQHCKKCGKAGHNKRTCKKDTTETDN